MKKSFIVSLFSIAMAASGSVNAVPITITININENAKSVVNVTSGGVTVQLVPGILVLCEFGGNGTSNNNGGCNPTPPGSQDSKESDYVSFNLSTLTVPVGTQNGAVVMYSDQQAVSDPLDTGDTGIPRGTSPFLTYKYVTEPPLAQDVNGNITEMFTYVTVGGDGQVGSSVTSGIDITYVIISDSNIPVPEPAAAFALAPGLLALAGLAIRAAFRRRPRTALHRLSAL